MIIDNRDLTLQPRQSYEISLRICPLRSGVLNIKGIKWLIEEKVWSLHSFHIKGELLQDNLEHRSQQARSPPNQLISFHIIDSQPWLSFDETSTSTSSSDEENILVPESILQGQVIKCQFKIHNIGRVKACKMVLKANVPWIYVGEVVSYTTSF